MRKCDITHVHVWHDSFARVIGFCCICVMICVPWHICMCVCVCHDTSACVCVCAMTHLHVRQREFGKLESSLKSALEETREYCMCDMTHLNVRYDSFARVIGKGNWSGHFFKERECIWDMIMCSTFSCPSSTCNIHMWRDMCNTLQRTATHCNTLRHTNRNVHMWHDICNTLQHTATHCNTLQHTATRCDILTAMFISDMTYAAHCSTLQHTAAHCNTLQHIATY